MDGKKDLTAVKFINNLLNGVTPNKIINYGFGKKFRNLTTKISVTPL